MITFKINGFFSLKKVREFFIKVDYFFIENYKKKLIIKTIISEFTQATYNISDGLSSFVLVLFAIFYSQLERII